MKPVNETQTWGACTYGLALVVCVRILFCRLQIGVVAREPYEAGGRGFEPHN